MCKYLMGILLGIGICFPAYADYSCATAFMNDSTELAKLNNEIGAKSSALQKKLDDKCMPEYRKRSTEHSKLLAAIENKEGEYKKLSKSERQALIDKKKYEYQNSQTKYSEECWGGEDGKQLDEYKECLRSISKQLKYLQEQHKLNKAEGERKAKEAQKAQEEQEASASAGKSAEENAVEVPGMITSSPTAASSSDAGGKAASLITASSSWASSAVGGGTSSSGSLFSELTEKGLFIFGGLREIIYAVAGFGIMAVAVGGFFGVINWRWLSAIIMGLMVISLASSIINYMVDAEVISDSMITDSLINAS